MSGNFVIHLSFSIDLILERFSDEELARLFTCDGKQLTAAEAHEYLNGLKDKGQTSLCPGCPNPTAEGRCGCPR